jgi:hypothetical protein
MSKNPETTETIKTETVRITTGGEARITIPATPSTQARIAQEINALGSNPNINVNPAKDGGYSVTKKTGS